MHRKNQVGEQAQEHSSPLIQSDLCLSWPRVSKRKVI